MLKRCECGTWLAPWPLSDLLRVREYDARFHGFREPVWMPEVI